MVGKKKRFEGIHRPQEVYYTGLFIYASGDAWCAHCSFF